MENEHISIEEMEQVAYFSGKLDSEEGKKFLEIASKVNTHISQCQDCLNKYKEIMEKADTEKWMADKKDNVKRLYDEIFKDEDSTEVSTDKKELVDIEESKKVDSIEMRIAKIAAKNWGQAEPQNLEEAKGITWGSEISSIKGIVKVLKLPAEMEEQMIQDVYESDSISPQVANEIQKRIIGITRTTEPNIIKMLSTVHDEWVRNNPNNFMKENDGKRRNKEYQFVPLELLSWKEAKSDLLFLKPILEASGINIDEKQVEEQFEVAQKEFLAEHGIVSEEALKRKLQSGSKFYPALEGLETKFGGNIENLLKDQTILEDFVNQVKEQVPIKSREELTKEIIASENPKYDDVMWLGKGITQPEWTAPDNPISEREVVLSKLIGHPYSQDFLSIEHHPVFGPYSRALRGPYGHEQEIEQYENLIINRKREAEQEKDENGCIEYEEYGKKETIETSKLELIKAGLDPKKFEWKSLEQIKTEKQENASVSPKDIADADKEQALTTTEVGGFKKLLNKLRDMFKGKGEK